MNTFSASFIAIFFVNMLKFNLMKNLIDEFKKNQIFGNEILP